MSVQIADVGDLPWMAHRSYSGVYTRSVVDSGISTDLEVKVVRITLGAQVPPHTHLRSAETFCVLSGEGAFYVQGHWVP